MRRFALYLGMIMLLGSCNFNSSVMFKTPKDYPYTVDQTIGNVEYRIAPNDRIGFSVYTNDGFKLVDLTTSAENVSTTVTSRNQTEDMTEFVVEPDGMIKLPIVGKVKVDGLTVREAEKMLEDKYATFYNKPFVLMRVKNRRAIVFPGARGAGRVVNIENENTTLIEALALAGGIVDVGKAKEVKLIRGDLRNPKVIKIDLSTIEGMTQTNLLLQANDIIYVTPRARISEEALGRIIPIVGIITSIALVWQIVDNSN